MGELGRGLHLRDLAAGWGRMHVLSGVTFDLPPGQCLAVLGRNGVGKTTLLSTIIGRATLLDGALTFDGKAMTCQPTHKRAWQGIGFVPQEREIFPSLTVEENLTVAKRDRGTGGWNLERVYALFPRLQERRANRGNQLSGGEQQMLSIGRALMGNPSLLLMDEPMEGLAPSIVDQLLAAVQRIRAETDMAILVVEQHVDIALELTSRIVVLDRGTVVLNNAAGGSAPHRREIERLIGIAA